MTRCTALSLSFYTVTQCETIVTKQKVGLIKAVKDTEKTTWERNLQCLSCQKKITLVLSSGFHLS